MPSMRAASRCWWTLLRRSIRIPRRHLSTSTINAPTWSLPLPEGVLGQVSDILCEVGSRVYVEEVVAIVETDKVSVDVKAQRSGVVRAILVGVGDDVKVRQPIYALDEAAEFPPTDSEQRVAERRWARAHDLRLEEERAEQDRLLREYTERERQARANGKEPNFEWRWQNSARPRQTGTGGGGSGARQHNWQQWSDDSSRRQRTSSSYSRQQPGRRKRAGVGARPAAHQLQPSEVASLPVGELIGRVLSHSHSGAHATLGLPVGSAASSVRKRYLALVLRIHPDQAGEDQPRAREAFAAVDGAFRSLKSGAARW